MIRRIVIGLLVVSIAVAGYFAFELWFRTGSGQEVLVRIPEGSTFDEILDSLENSGVVSNRTAFRLLAVTSGGDSKIKPGTYKFHRGTASAQLLDALVEGRSTVRVKVTFPEGITVRRMASIAAQQLGTDSAEFVSNATNRTFLKSIGIQASTAEGYLMPDTYLLFWGEDSKTLMRRMADLFKEFYNDSLKSLAPAQKLTPYEVVILASIVEGEAVVDSERPTIAGLYLNRLRRGIKLAADPTVQYLLPDGPRRLLYRDLDIESPYNTYRNAGLPPAPINNPSRASILAVLRPEAHDYIFMVAKADGSGRHTFTRTAAEHERAVAEYRARRND